MPPKSHSAVRKDSIENIYPLSPLQEGMLFHAQSESKDPYVQQFRCVLEGRLDADLLRRAWERVVARHGVLRTAFVWKRREKPLQVTYREVSLPWREVDTREWSDAERETEIQAFLDEDLARGFDLARPPLLRCALFRLSDEAWRFVWTFHHVILDGWSVARVLDEVMAIYLPSLEGRQVELGEARPFADYIAWLRQQDLGRAEAFWRQEFEGLEVSPRLPSQRESDKHDGRDRDLMGSMSGPRLQVLETWARGHQLTLNTVVQGVWALVLSRYCGVEDVVFGTTVSSRPREIDGVEKIIGMMINTLPVRCRLAPGELLTEAFDRLQQHQLEAREFDYTPLWEIQRWSGFGGGSQLFETHLTFENFPRLADSGSERQELRFSTPHSEESTNYPLSAMVRAGDKLDVRLFYKREFFDPAMIGRLLGHFLRLLGEVAESSEARVGDLEILGAAERQQLLVEWSDTVEHRPASLFPDAFEAMASSAPEAVAIADAEGTWTYAALERRSAQIAAEIQAVADLNGAAPEPVVAVLAERGFELWAAAVGILRAGAVYLPLDPDHPAGRHRRVLERARPVVVFAQQAFSERLAEALAELPEGERPAMRPLEPSLRFDAAPQWQRPRLDPERLAYVFFTSGSTGEPKGAMVRHGGLYNHLLANIDDFGLTSDDHLAQIASQCFDISIWQCLAPLLSGGRVSVFNREEATVPARLLQTVARRRVTVFESVPTLLKLVAEEAGQIDPGPALRAVVSIGEALPAQVVRQWLEARPGVPMVNAYGPTECSDNVSHQWFERAPQGEAVSIGRPLANTALRVLDGELRPIPLGAIGQLVAAGSGVGRGYLGAPALTAQVFVPDPSGDGGRVYLTGDLASHRTDGRLDYHGRVDHQVKVRGMRIELGEIEAVLAEQFFLSAAAVDVRGGLLVAWVVLEEGQELPALSELRAYLASRLPGYMVPSHYLEIERIPLTSNGKIDRKALPEPEVSRDTLENTYREPTNPTQEKLVEIWQEVLGTSPVGVGDNFFELGGNSIMGLRLMALVQERLGQEVPLTLLFQDPTIEGISEYIDDGFRPGFLRQQNLRYDGLGEHPTAVMIQPSGEKRPFFLVAPLGGIIASNVIWGPLELGRQLDPDRPYIGIQSPPLAKELRTRVTATTPAAEVQRLADAWQPTPELLPELARGAVEAIREVQEEGPYHLGGFCSGSFLAFEVAHQLLDRGEEVSSLVVIDSGSPASQVPRKEWRDIFFARERKRRHESRELAWIVKYDLSNGKVAKELDDLVAEIRDLPEEEWWSYALEQLLSAKAISPDAPPEAIQQFFVTRESNMSIVHRTLRVYEPRTYPGRMDLFPNSEAVDKSRDSHLGWGKICNGEISVHVLPGNHFDILKEPAVHLLASGLEAGFQAAEEKESLVLA